MQEVAPKRTRRVIDTVMLVAVSVCLGIALVRVAAVAATVPYAYYTGSRLAAAARQAGEPAPTARISERIANSRPFRSWWSERRVPYREGGDYLGVLSHHAPARSLGSVIGVLAARDRLGAGRIREVFVPEDRVALYGEESGTLMTKADGTTVRTSWGLLSNDAAMFSDTPVDERPYNPVLTYQQAATLAQATDLVEGPRDFFVGSSKPGQSGTWVLLVKPGERREYLLVPIEAAPAGVGR